MKVILVCAKMDSPSNNNKRAREDGENCEKASLLDVSILLHFLRGEEDQETRENIVDQICHLLGHAPIPPWTISEAQRTSYGAEFGATGSSQTSAHASSAHEHASSARPSSPPLAPKTRASSNAGGNEEGGNEEGGNEEWEIPDCEGHYLE